MEVKIKLQGGIMPMKMHRSDAAFDLYLPKDVWLNEGRNVIPLGFSLEMPDGYAATIQPRSGFSARGIEGERCGMEAYLDADVIRGLIDSNYRGIVGVIINSRDSGFVKKKTRIAQMQIIEVPKVDLVKVDELTETERGDNGFGSTNKDVY